MYEHLARAGCALTTSGLTLAQTLGPSRLTVNNLHPATYSPTDPSRSMAATLARELSPVRVSADLARTVERGDTEDGGRGSVQEHGGRAAGCLSPSVRGLVSATEDRLHEILVAHEFFAGGAAVVVSKGSGPVF